MASTWFRFAENCRTKSLFPCSIVHKNVQMVIVVNYKLKRKTIDVFQCKTVEFEKAFGIFHYFYEKKSIGICLRYFSFK